MVAAIIQAVLAIAARVLPALIMKWITPRAPADPTAVALDEVRRAGKAASAVDTSQKAIDNDPNNLDR